MAPRSGPPSAIRSSSMSCAGICASPVICAFEARRMMNLAEYRTHRDAPRRFPALGGAGRRGRRPQQRRLLPAHRALSRTRSRFALSLPNWSPSPAGSTMPFAVSAPVGRSSSRRSAIRQAAIRTARSRTRLPRWSTPSARRSSRRRGRHFEFGLLPDASSTCRPPKKPLAPKASSTKAGTRGRSRRARILTAFVDQNGSRSAAPRWLHAGVPLAR